MYISLFFALASSFLVSFNTLGQVDKRAALKMRCVVNVLNILPIRDIQNIVLDYLNGYEFNTKLSQKKEAVSHVSFSPDGKLLLCGGSPDGALEIFKNNGKLFKKYALFATQKKDLTPAAGMAPACYKAVSSTTFSSDQEFLAIASLHENVVIWKRTSEHRYKPFQIIIFPGQTLIFVGFTPEGKTLIISGTIGVLGYKLNEKQNKFEKYYACENISCNAAALSRCGTYISFSCHANKINILKSDNRAYYRLVSDCTKYSASTLTFSSDEKYLAAGCGSQLIMHKMAAEHDKELICSEVLDAGTLQMITELAFSPDTELIVIGFKDQATQIWRRVLDEWRFFQKLEGQQFVREIGFSPDQKYIVTGSQDGSVCVWKNQAIEILLAEKSTS